MIMMSEAAKRRESKRQMFIENALVSMDALIQEMIDNGPGMLSRDQAARFRILQAQMGQVGEI